MDKPIDFDLAISVRAPWWWFILHAGKDIENRDWPTKVRGRVGLHASKWYRQDEVLEDMETGAACLGAKKGPKLGIKLTHRMLIPSGGCLVGSVNIVDCVERSASLWFFGRYGFVLEDPIAFAAPIPCKGALGFFRPASAPIFTAEVARAGGAAGGGLSELEPKGTP